MRLQKFLSDAGVASRRHAEELIREGRVLVNDEVVVSLPAFVDPERDRVVVSGNIVRPQPLEYWILNKPRGVVATHRDPAGRPRAVDLLPPGKQRLFPVGRLDEDSSGLLLLTNDGELAQRITHPRYGVPKVYRAEVKGWVGAEVVQKLLRGVHLAEGPARAAWVEVLRTATERSLLEITLTEGRNRQVRRMLARLGFPVKALQRVRIGRLVLKGLPVGAARELSRGELRALQRGAEAPQPRRPRAARAGKRGAPDQSRGLAEDASRKPGPGGSVRRIIT